ncbi:MAG: hypothetical protein FJW40_08385 [Acidobacteria bacterium]|nr:hypothetical protein [Acidobacteriota bacterium]
MLGMVETALDSEIVYHQFNRLIGELLKGTINRNVFQPWEITLLLDIDSCQLDEKRKRDILVRYQKAVHKQLGRGSSTPITMSEFLQTVRSRSTVS